jgi:hypothetical protein
MSLAEHLPLHCGLAPERGRTAPVLRPLPDKVSHTNSVVRGQPLRNSINRHPTCQICINSQIKGFAAICLHTTSEARAFLGAPASRRQRVGPRQTSQRDAGTPRYTSRKPEQDFSLVVSCGLYWSRPPGWTFHRAVIGAHG